MIVTVTAVLRWIKSKRILRAAKCRLRIDECKDNADCQRQTRDGFVESYEAVKPGSCKAVTETFSEPLEIHNGEHQPRTYSTTLPAPGTPDSHGFQDTRMRFLVWFSLDFAVDSRSPLHAQAYMFFPQMPPRAVSPLADRYHSDERPPRQKLASMQQSLSVHLVILESIGGAILQSG